MYKKKKRKTKKYKGVRRRRNRRRLSASRYGPIIIAILVIAGIGLAVFLGYRYAFPAVMNQLGIEWPPPASPAPTAEPTPEPTPDPVERLNATDLQQEMIPPSSVTYIADPARAGNSIIYAGGASADSKGPSYSQIYLYDIQTGKSTAVAETIKQNDEIFRPRANEDWILFLDQKTSGGGLLRAINRKTKDTTIVKEYYDGMLEYTLVGNRVCWIERTGSSVDKLFLVNLETGENVALEVFSNSAFGQSVPYMTEDEIVWASFDVNSKVDVMTTNDIGAIAYIQMDDPNKEIKTYTTDMYVHDPMSSGNVRIWTDQNSGPSPTLYMSIAEAAPVVIDTEVNSYGIGDNFVAYVKNEELYLYFWEYPDSSPKKLSREGERCILSSVEENTVTWFNTGVSDRIDVVKFAEIVLPK